MKIRKNILYIATILASCALSITLEATADTAPNHLTPIESLPASTFDYYENLYITFKEGYGEDSILQTITIPSLANEFVTGIKKSASGYEAFLIVPQYSIRMLMMYERAKHGDERAKHLVFPKNIPDSYLENSTQINKRIIPENLAFRLATIWTKELSKTMPAAKNDQRLLLDPDTYIFSINSPSQGLISGRITAPEAKSSVGALSTLAYHLKNYTLGKINATKLDSEVSYFEKLHLDIRQD